MRYLFALAFVALMGYAELIDAAKVGGKVSPAGVEIDVDLPAEHHLRNKGGSDGAGLCVFTSIDHAARWQRVDALIGFRDYMTKFPGGGYPEKVKQYVSKLSKSRNLPEPAYIQIFGAVEDDLKILEAACKSGRFPSITYGISPTGRYGGRRIAHMVSMPHCDLEKGEFCVLDNNHPGIDAYEWMNKTEFIRAYTSGGRAGWSVILLDNGPPPVPWTEGGSPLPPAPITPAPPKMPAPKP
jgi:hypothetical protein